VEYVLFALVLAIIVGIIVVRRRRRDPNDPNADLPPCCRS
jgi:hypothetical protein